MLVLLSMSYPQRIEPEPSLQSTLATPSSLNQYNTGTTPTLSSHRGYTRTMHKLPPALNLSSGTTTELNAMIDAHLAWQEEGGERPTSKGTLLVDWDGSGDPVVSYRKVEVEMFEEEGVEHEQDDISVEKNTEEEEEWFMQTLVPSPLRSVASMSLPSSPTRKGFASMPSSPVYNGSFVSMLASPLCKRSFASMPASPAATEPITRMSFDRAYSRLNTHKVLPLLPGQRESPVTEECSEWDETSFYEPVCAYTERSGLTLERFASHCSHSEHTSLESIVEERFALNRGYDAVDVEDWVERNTERRRERNGRKKERRGTREKLLGALDKEWSGAKSVFKKMF